MIKKEDGKNPTDRCRGAVKVGKTEKRAAFFQRRKEKGSEKDIRGQHYTRHTHAGVH